jgi:hypothetical protein
MGMEEKSIADLEGGADLCEWFGGQPSFHDCRLLALEIRQGEPSRFAASIFRSGPEKDNDGFLIVSLRGEVSFEFQGLIEVELYDFEEVAYLDGVTFFDDRDGISMKFEASAGVHGRIKSKKISISFRTTVQSA